MALVIGILLALFAVDGVWEYVVVAAGGGRPAVGVEALVGRVVEVDEEGWGRVGGERWRVRGAGPGESARVVGVDELTLVVERE